jgi:hypothetical protein
MGDAVRWIDSNEASINAFAATVSGVAGVAFEVLATAIGGVVAAFAFLVDHQDATLATLIAIGTVIAVAVLPGMIATAAATLAAFAPVILLGVAIAAVAFGIIKLVRNWATVKRAVADVWQSIKNAAGRAFSWIESGIARVGDFFVSAGDTALAAWRAIIDWIAAKIAWVTNKIEAVRSFAQDVRDVTTGSIALPAGFGASPSVALGGPNATANNGGSIMVYNTINASGLTADQAASVVDQKLQSTYRDGLANLTGGK